MSGEKSAIRRKMLDRRNSLPAMEILERSNRVMDGLLTLDEFSNAKVVMLYISFGTEVNTHGLIRSLIGEKTVLVPVVTDKEKGEMVLSELKDWKELSSGAYGILEPRELREREGSNVDISIVPGIVFDRKGNRIGYGGGYYDRLLKKIEGEKIGIAYGFQIMDTVPVEAHDTRVDMVLTDETFLRAD